MNIDLDDIDPGLIKAFVERHRPENYAAFVKRVKEDVREALFMLQQNANHHQKSSEDTLTSHLVDVLKAFKHDASQDENYRGHVDILVKHKRFVWLAEAKKWKSNPWLFKGSAQLLNRYSSGIPTESHGALIIYCFKPGVSKILVNWKNYIEACGKPAVNTKTKKSKNRKNILSRVGVVSVTDNFKEELSFDSEHTHDSGYTYNVWHLAANLYHNPTDPNL